LLNLAARSDVGCCKIAISLIFPSDGEFECKRFLRQLRATIFSRRAYLAIVAGEKLNPANRKELTV